MTTGIEEKIEYEKGKVKKLEEQIIKVGGRFDNSKIILDANLEIVKEVLFENDLISRDDFKLRFLKKEQIILTSVLEFIKELKKQKSKLIVPKVVPPRDLKDIKA